MGRPRIFRNASERAAAWKAANPERARRQNVESVRRWRARYPDRARAAREAERAAYGLSVEELAALEERQGGRCAICGRKPKRRLAIDHDHRTGEVRGLLCRDCNLALGLFGDDVRRLLAALAYLVRRGGR